MKVMLKLSGILLCLNLSLMPFGVKATPAVSCGTTISSFPYNESFESSLGAWSNGGPNNLWQRDANGTSSSNTGPSSGDNGTSYYVYTEASGSGGNPFKVHSLVGPCFDLTAATSADFSFSYHMYGTYMGELTFQVSTNGGSTWTTLWNKNGNQGNQWFQETISLNAYVGQTINVRFYGYTGDSWSSDMAVDEISVTTTAPPPGIVCTNTITNFPYVESFENVSNDWVEATSTNVWRRNSGTTSSFNTGPSSAADGTYYMYTESSSPNYPSVTEYFTGPCFDLNATNDAYFSFQYHMLGATMGSIELQIQTDASIGLNGPFASPNPT
ncbi:MAG: choice-of-anchor J domain-containing protein [Bacteroidota bacterium]